MMLFDK